jgi:hypothetical protein
VKQRDGDDAIGGIMITGVEERHVAPAVISYEPLRDDARDAEEELDEQGLDPETRRRSDI